MARYSQSIQGVATVAATTRTLIQLVTSANEQAFLVEFGISFDGSSSTTPIRCDLLKQTSAGTSVAATESPWNADDAATPQTSGLITFSGTEPTDAGQSAILSSWFVSANNGLLIVQYPLGREPKIALSSRLGLRIVTPTGVNPNVTAYMVWEE